MIEINKVLTYRNKKNSFEIQISNKKMKIKV